MITSTKAIQKVRLAKDILGNSVYLPGSGVYEKAKAALEKLSYDALRAIKLTVQTQQQD